ncbi:Poly(rC)-binding protein 3 [Trichoplax sp. H2]|nr:Poly(rC)-binding protein 3 [Trichoplax sp. H2]|eukprot:RDD40650.1 Poly(rC)-binding protein 3 [Trichoplax sp. H2]
MSLIGMLRPLWRNARPNLQCKVLTELARNNVIKSHVPSIATITNRYLCTDINTESSGIPPESRSGLITHRFLVEDLFVSGLIGRAGNIIGGIRKQSGCSIKIEDFIDEESCKREVCIYGPSKDVDLAKELIQSRLNILLERYNETGKALVSKHLLVENDHVGAVIGQRGNNITKIRNQCDCQVRIARQPQPGTTTRAIVISGDPEEVDRAIEMVKNSVENRHEE